MQQSLSEIFLQEYKPRTEAFLFQQLSKKKMGKITAYPIL
jgi:hypothetical protein